MALAGLTSVGPALFESLVPDVKPSAEDMEKAANAARFSKAVNIKDVFVETYDLGNAKDAKDYAKRMKEMYRGMIEKTHVILCNDRQFVKEDGKPRWVAHLEWMEFELHTKSHPSVPASSKE